MIIKLTFVKFYLIKQNNKLYIIVCLYIYVLLYSDELFGKSVCFFLTSIIFKIFILP